MTEFKRFVIMNRLLNNGLTGGTSKNLKSANIPFNSKILKSKGILKALGGEVNGYTSKR